LKVLSLVSELTIPLAPLRRGTRTRFKVPLLKGDLGGSGFRGIEYQTLPP
jgi:hypothetical protein